MRYEHEFEDEKGNEIAELTDITYQVLYTYVQPDSTGAYIRFGVKEDVIVFTHIVRIRPEAIDMDLMLEGLQCTAKTAMWCGIHGVCTCFGDNESQLSDSRCPLSVPCSGHSSNSPEVQ